MSSEDNAAGADNAASILTDVLLICSIVCATLTIITFLIHRKLMTYPIKLICFLCVCIIIGFTFFLLIFESFVYDEWPCVPFAVITHYFFLANFCWTFCVAFNFYQMIVRRNRDSQKLEIGYHLFSWIAPAIVVTVVGSTGEYGDIGQVCWMKNDVTIFVAFFLPGLILISLNFIFFYFVAREIHETLSSSSSEGASRKEFCVYLSITVSIGVSWTFAFLLFIVPNQTAITVFLYMFSLTAPAQGVFIFLAYVINAKVLARWCGFFGMCIPICSEWGEALDTTASTGSGSSKHQSRSNQSGASSA